MAQMGNATIRALIVLLSLGPLALGVPEAVAQADEFSPARIEIEIPSCITSDTPFDLHLTAVDESRVTVRSLESSVRISAPHGDLFLLDRDGSLGPVSPILLVDGEATVENLTFAGSGSRRIEVRYGTGPEARVVGADLRVLPGVLSILPPILAIALALIFRQVVIALFCGIWLGASFLHGLNPLKGFLRALDTYVVDAVGDPSHAAIILFSLTLGGMVGILARSGGIRGIVDALSRHARTARSAQVSTWAMGLLIFFDDYANTLLVGNTMRSVTDRFRVSREKLSFLVDSTAAPVTSIAFISTWIGYELGLIADAFQSIGLEKNVYLVFVSTIPYRFYSILLLVFVFLISWTGRDYGGMLAAERRARTTGKVQRDGAVPLSQMDLKEEEVGGGARGAWWTGLLPILTVIGVTVVGLYVNGRSSLVAGGAVSGDLGLHEIIGAADSFAVLMWAAFAGSVVAGVLALAQKALNLTGVVDAWVVGVRAMVVGMIILVCAWAIGRVCVDLQTGEWVFQATRDVLSPRLLPVLCFLLAGGVAFATGTSWGSMAILMPLVVPLAFRLSAEPGIQLGTIAAILAGSTFGDHCSPISDTTVMSSMASAADHIDHVRTQAPYALTVGAIACLAGYLPAGFGLPVWVLLPIGLGLLVVVLRVVGKKVEVQNEKRKT
jgi:Na+/H+ antiporter NhaC